MDQRPQGSSERPLPDEISKQLRRWNLIAGVSRAVYIVLGVAGIVCPLVVGAFSDTLGTTYVRVLSLIATGSVGLFAAFQVGDLATKWRDAWRHLYDASIRYRLGMIDLPELISAYQKGEQIIAGLQPDPFAAQARSLRKPDPDATRSEQPRPRNGKAGSSPPG